MARLETVGARELKTRLGRYLRRVRQGRTLIVTERGEPVAELRPVAAASTPVEARLDRLVALGVVSRRQSGPLPPFTPVRSSGKPASDAVAEDRDERF